MAETKWTDWLALILVVIVVLMIVFFNSLLTLFPPTMSAGAAMWVLIAIIVVLVIAIIALLANGANPLKPLAGLVNTVVDTIGDVIGSTGATLLKASLPFIVLFGGGIFLLNSLKGSTQVSIKSSDKQTDKSSLSKGGV